MLINVFCKIIKMISKEYGKLKIEIREIEFELYDYAFLVLIFVSLIFFMVMLS